MARSLARIASALGIVFGHTASRWGEEVVPSPDDSERAVEVPWAASAIASCVGFWLDIGYAFAEPRFWESIPSGGWRKHLRYGYGLDMAPAQVEHPLDVELRGDIMEFEFTSLPRFDLITCISTLEHVGCDNTIYVEGMNRRGVPVDIQQEVVVGLIGALSRRGRLLISVPFGTHQDHGWFLQYDVEMIRDLRRHAEIHGGTLSSEAYYALTSVGWQRSTPAQMNDLTYRAVEHRASGVALLEFSRR